MTFDWIAAYGAVLATIHALIGVWRYIFREPVKLRVNTNMIKLPKDGKKYVVANVINRHPCAIYVTHFHGMYWKNKTERFLYPKKAAQFIINDASIPKMIEPGHYYMFMGDMASFKELYPDGGAFKIGITHTMSDKPLLKKINVIYKDSD